MSIRVSRIVILGSSGLLSFTSLGAVVSAQEAPAEVTIEKPVVVTTPSPIQRRLRSSVNCRLLE